MKKFKVKGNSMYPVLKNGDSFLARRRKEGEIPETGSIVVAEYDGRLIVKQFFPQARQGQTKAFLLGFNKRKSRDSRCFGTLPLDKVKYIRITDCGSFVKMFRGLRDWIYAAFGRR